MAVAAAPLGLNCFASVCALSRVAYAFSSTDVKGSMRWLSQNVESYLLCKRIDNKNGLFQYGICYDSIKFVVIDHGCLI